jgi:hypothetical protein
MKYFKSLIIGLVVTCFVEPKAHAQTNHWLKKLGFDSLLQTTYYVDSYKRDESFNNTNWTEDIGFGNRRRL